MCHSVEMYLPHLTRAAAEHAFRPGVERARARTVLRWLSRLKASLALRRPRADVVEVGAR